MDDKKLQSLEINNQESARHTELLMREIQDIERFTNVEPTQN